jgi:hypothetical protein
MNLQEQVSRIKTMMGVLTEDEVTFPITVSDSYNTAKYGKGDCDTFHSFNDNGRKEIGGMNTKVNKVLMDVYNKGFNPDITAVDVEMNSDTMEVKWSVTINKSEDGNAWTGLYSRGGGAISQPGKYPDSISTTSGHASIKSSKTSNYILKRGTPDKMVPVNIFVHSPKKGCRVKQIFYKYTLKEYPTLEEKVEKPKEEPIEKLPIGKPEPLQRYNDDIEIMLGKPTTPTPKKDNIISRLFNK